MTNWSVLKRRRTPNLKATSQAERAAMREGIEAKRQGKPRNSPYVDAEGNVIPMLRTLHQAWLNGWSA